MANPTPPPPPPARPSPRPAPPPPAPLVRRHTFGERSALNIAPLFLRLLLGGTFLWLGLGKVMTTIQVQGSDALTLYTLGVIDGPSAAGAQAPPRTEPAPQFTPPAEEPAHPLAEPPDQPPSDPVSPAPVDPDGPGLSANAFFRGIALPGDGGGRDRAILAMTPSGRSPMPRVCDGPGPGLTSGAPPMVSAVLASFQPAARTPRLASDFVHPIEVPAMHRTTLRLAAGASPSVSADGTLFPPILPAWMGADPWARMLAWAWTVIELLGGSFILLGLGTRLWALLLALTLGLAIWMTEIGPAVQSGATVLGFLPAGRETFSGQAWMPLLWLLALLCASLSLLFCGPGSLSLDRAMFRGRRRGDEDD